MTISNLESTVYAFDPYASNAQNYITQSKKLTALSVGAVCVPAVAPFYAKDLVVSVGTVELKYGVDYYLGLEYFIGSHTTAQKMYAAIWVINPAYYNSTLEIKARVLGSDYSAPESKITEYITNTMVDPTNELWEAVIGDVFFPPVDIQFDVDTFNTESQLITAINNVKTAAANESRSDEFYRVANSYVSWLESVVSDSAWTAHIDDIENPHWDQWWTIGALHSAGTAANTSLVQNKTLTDIINAVIAAGPTTAQMSSLVPRDITRSFTGSLVLIDHLSQLGFNYNGVNTPAMWFSGGNIDLLLTKSTTLHALSGDAKITTGATKLTVGYSAAAAADKLTLTNADGTFQVITTETLPELAQSVVGSTTVSVATVNTSTMTWTGIGTAGSPLKATVLYPAASQVQYGVVKLSSALNLNNDTIAATPAAVKALRAVVGGKLPNTATVNGRVLSTDIVITAADIGLDMVSNVADIDLPANQAHNAALSSKATLEHSHELADFKLPVATQDTAGTVKYGDNAISTDDVNALTEIVGDLLTNQSGGVLLSNTKLVKYIPRAAATVDAYTVTIAPADLITPAGRSVVPQADIDLSDFTGIRYVYLLTDSKVYSSSNAPVVNSAGVLGVGIAVVGGAGVDSVTISTVQSMRDSVCLDGHAKTNPAHAVDVYTKAAANLGLVPNYPVYPQIAASDNALFTIDQLDQLWIPTIVSGVVPSGTVLDFTVLPAEANDSNCVVLVAPDRIAPGAAVLSYGVEYDSATRSVIGRCYRYSATAPGYVVENIDVRYTIIYTPGGRYIPAPSKITAPAAEMYNAAATMVDEVITIYPQ